ncbi:MAG: class F sortase [Dehalococcoidia bacterium]
MGMRTVRAFSIGSLLGGLVLLGAGIACSGGDDDDDEVQETETATSTATATVTNTPTSTPSPTPTPFNGKVARMTIPELGVDHPIEEVGIKQPENELDTPKDATGAIGWYYIYDKPGFGKNSLYSAHVNYNGRNGPFAKLNNVVPESTQITVQMADGPTYTYLVFSKVRYTIYDIPMGDLISQPAKPPGEEWITLITCSCAPGRVLDPDGDGFGECLDRDVVTAKRIS